MSFQPGLARCDACNDVWLDAQYDYDRVANIWRPGFGRRDRSLWRYIELLPVRQQTNINSMGEGYTPLRRATKIQARLGHPNLWIKDERQSPTSSFKDRQAAVATSFMREAGITECALASTGNAAAAYAAYCARADIKLWVFLTSMVPAAKMREAALYGAEVIKVTGTYDQAKKVAADFATRRGIQFDKGAKSIPGKESMKTIAFEIAEELGWLLDDSAPWRAPDWFIQAVSGGIGPIGVQKGFEELYRMGLIDRIPKIGVIQAAGCSPMVQAYAKNQPKANPVIPETRITVLSTGDPGMGYEILYQANQKYGGAMVDVSDEEAFDAMRHLAQTEGYSVEPATAVAFAGVNKLMAQGWLKPNEVVIINCSGHTFPVEKHIMDEETVLDVHVGAKAIGVPMDGLGSALERLDEQVKTIAVIDDNPMDSRLIRRLLQAKKPYRVFEANNAAAGLQLVKERQPDLVVSDLTMPDMDGFTLLEALKSDPLTAHIPVIVVSAKDLTPEDEAKLAPNTASIWLKGAFSTNELAEHVIQTLSGTQEPASTAPSPALKKIVIVDDNPADARLISRMLQTQRPLDIKTVQAGQQAIDVIRTEKPDLVILDLIIPDKSGFEILTELKQDPALNKIPVVIITARDLSAAEERMLAANNVASMWLKGRQNRAQLLADVEAQLG